MVRYIYKSVSETGALMGKELGEVHYSPVVRQELTRPFQDSHAFLTATICPDSWTKVQAEPSPSSTAARVFFFIYMPQRWAHGKGEDVNLSGTTSVYFSS